MAPHLLDSLTCFLEKNGQLSSPLFPPKASCKIAKSLGKSAPHPKKGGPWKHAWSLTNAGGNSPSSLLFVISKAGDFDSRLSPPEHRILGGVERGGKGQGGTEEQRLLCKDPQAPKLRKLLPLEPADYILR